jgi:hypothetical protein
MVDQVASYFNRGASNSGRLRPGALRLTVSVPVTSGTPTVGTIAGRPAVFAPGDPYYDIATSFAPLAAGTSVLSVGIPAGFSSPSTGREITATVQ